MTLCYDRAVGDAYIKMVEPREEAFWTKLFGVQDLNITPEILAIGAIPPEYNPDEWFPDHQKFRCVTTKLYPLTLRQWLSTHPNDTTYFDKLPELVQKLHDQGILQGDLGTQNIVINPDTGDIRLIDFDCAEWIDQDLQKQANPDANLWGETYYFHWEELFKSYDEMLYFEKYFAYIEDHKPRTRASFV
jgi:serine/threonine protein kinase